jgi:hypothetical protein
MPFHFRKIEILGLSRKQMHLMAAVRETLGHLVDRTGASVAAIAVDHGKRDSHEDSKWEAAG